MSTIERGTARTGQVVFGLLVVNTSASTFVLLRVSIEIGDVTSSGLLAGAVLAAPWLPALVLVKPLNRLLSRQSPGRLTHLAEVASLLLTLAVLFSPGTGSVLLALAAVVLLARGFFEAVTRSATSVLLRVVIPANRFNRANTFAEIAKLTGTSAGAVLAGFADPALSLRACLALNAAGLVVTVLLSRALPRHTPELDSDPAAPTRGWPRLANPLLRHLFALFLLVAFWQGLHIIALNVVPREVLAGTSSTVGVFVAVCAAGFFTGSLTALPVQRLLGRRLPVVTWALLPMPFLLSAVLLARPVPTLILYAVFIVLFEVAFVQYNNLLLTEATVDETPAVVTLRATLMPLCVVVSALGLGLVSDLLGPVPAVTAVVATTVVVAAIAATRLAGTRPGPASADQAAVSTTP
jgi:hypothetical protein